MIVEDFGPATVRALRLLPTRSPDGWHKAALGLSVEARFEHSQSRPPVVRTDVSTAHSSPP